VSGETRSSLWTTVGVAASVVGLTIAQPLVTTAVPLVLAALIVEGQSTTPGSGIGSFLNSKFPLDRPNVYVDFLTDPFGIWRALTQNPGEQSYDPDNILASSGLGTGNTPKLQETAWTPDGNLATTGGTPWTRNPVPQPIDPATPPVASIHEYDLFGDAQTYLLNPFAAANSLVAAIDQRLTPPNPQLPLTESGTVDCTAGGMSCTTDGGVIHITYVDEDGNTVTARVESVDGVTYVSYDAPDGLPLVRPLRELGAPGNALADALEPALTALVHYGYADNDPLANPGHHLGLLPKLSETRTFVRNFVDGVRQGAESLIDGPTATVGHVTASAAKPVLNEIRESAKFTPGDTTTGQNRPPKPVAISAKTALEQLTTAFTPKDDDKTAPSEAGAGSAADAPASQGE
jgi:hypothetical protein